MVDRNFEIHHSSVESALRATRFSSWFRIFRIRVHQGSPRAHSERPPGRGGDPQGTGKPVSGAYGSITGNALAQGVPDGREVSHHSWMTGPNSGWNSTSRVSNHKLYATTPFSHSHSNQAALRDVG